MGRKAGHDTDKGKGAYASDRMISDRVHHVDDYAGNKITRWAQSWLDWRENHHPTNAVTFVAFRQYLSELLGTALFVYVTTGSVVALGPQGLTTTPNTANNVAIALVFGFAIGAIVYATAKVSGGHLNPAVTLGFMVTSNKNIFKGLGYITSQILGGMLGSAFVRASTPRARESVSGVYNDVDALKRDSVGAGETRRDYTAERCDTRSRSFHRGTTHFSVGICRLRHGQTGHE